jgi:hypothetical protein
MFLNFNGNLEERYILIRLIILYNLFLFFIISKRRNNKNPPQ